MPMNSHSKNSLLHSNINPNINSITQYMNLQRSIAADPIRSSNYNNSNNPNNMLNSINFQLNRTLKNEFALAIKTLFYALLNLNRYFSEQDATNIRNIFAGNINPYSFSLAGGIVKDFSVKFFPYSDIIKEEDKREYIKQLFTFYKECRLAYTRDIIYTQNTNAVGDSLLVLNEKAARDEIWYSPIELGTTYCADICEDRPYLLCFIFNTQEEFLDFVSNDLSHFKKSHPWVSVPKEQSV